jgi:hypothetical protein
LLLFTSCLKTKRICRPIDAKTTNIE